MLLASRSHSVRQASKATDESWLNAQRQARSRFVWQPRPKWSRLRTKDTACFDFCVVCFQFSDLGQTCRTFMVNVSSSSSHRFDYVTSYVFVQRYVLRATASNTRMTIFVVNINSNRCTNFNKILRLRLKLNVNWVLNSESSTRFFPSLNYWIIMCHL